MAAIAQITTRLFKLIAPESPQRLTPYAVKSLGQHRRADISKAKRELGFEPTPIEDAIREQYEWFVAEGQVKGKSGDFTPSFARESASRSDNRRASTAR
jgi:nucleoside-diphosphate-sugar epimerase